MESMTGHKMAILVIQLFRHLCNIDKNMCFRLNGNYFSWGWKGFRGKNCSKSISKNTCDYRKKLSETCTLVKWPNSVNKVISKTLYIARYIFE